MKNIDGQSRCDCNLEEVITDLVQIRRLGEKKRDENLKFRRYLKSHTFVERQFRKAAEEVHGAIDCRQLADARTGRRLVRHR